MPRTGHSCSLLCLVQAGRNTVVYNVRSASRDALAAVRRQPRLNSWGRAERTILTYLASGSPENAYRAHINEHHLVEEVGFVWKSDRLASEGRGCYSAASINCSVSVWGGIWTGPVWPAAFFSKASVSNAGASLERGSTVLQSR